MRRNITAMKYNATRRSFEVKLEATDCDNSWDALKFCEYMMLVLRYLASKGQRIKIELKRSTERFKP